MLDPPWEVLWKCDALPEELYVDKARLNELWGITEELEVCLDTYWEIKNRLREEKSEASKARHLAREREQDELFAYRLMSMYRITIERYEELLSSQDGKCAVCKRIPDAVRRLAVDHDHGCCPGKKSCGECVRGLLCTGCNLKLGRMEAG